MPRALSKRGRRVRKNQVRNVMVRVAEDADLDALRARVSRFHVAVIERRLGQMRLTLKQKQAVVERIQHCMQHAFL